MTDIDWTLDDEMFETLRKLLLHAKRFGLWEGPLPSSSQTPPLPKPAYFHNDAGETIPAYACMQVTGTEEIGGQNFLVVEKPVDTDGTAGGFIFNGPEEVADDEEGKYQHRNIARAYKNTGTPTGGQKWRPTSGQWYLTQDDDGQFTACGEDDVDTDVFKIFSTVGGGASTPFRIFELTSSVSTGTPSTATATIRDADNESTSIETGVTLHLNLEMFDDLSSGSKGTCVLYDGIWWAVNAPCDTAELVTWHTGASDPTSGDGKVGDFWLTSTDGDYFEKTGTSTWTSRGNLKGPTGATGPTGAAGADGARWYDGSGAPSSGLGAANDYYLDNDTGDVYVAS